MRSRRRPPLEQSELDKVADGMLDDVLQLMPRLKGRAHTLRNRITAGPASRRLGEGSGSGNTPQEAFDSLDELRDVIARLISGRPVTD